MIEGIYVENGDPICTADISTGLLSAFKINFCKRPATRIYLSAFGVLYRCAEHTPRDGENWTRWW